MFLRLASLCFITSIVFLALAVSFAMCLFLNLTIPKEMQLMISEPFEPFMSQKAFYGT
jgi:hypothetical protein